MLRLLRVGAACVLLSGLVVATATPLAAQTKPPANKGNEPPPKPEPLVIRFQAAQRQKFFGYDVMVISGVEVLTGKPRQFAVPNEAPQDTNKPAKYDPRPAVADAVKTMKQGELLFVEPRASKDNIVWLDKAEAYKLAEHEDEPGAFVLFDSFSKDMDGVAGLLNHAAQIRKVL